MVKIYSTYLQLLFFCIIIYKNLKNQFIENDNLVIIITIFS